ncbi:DHH family phosphoesterase [Campylobacter canadensis]|uniref:3'-to-5' oligoribonuclease B n=1 Tax=Campylobacter canadensis TaxID=449520 RepID=A0ABS7WUL1_9BACT|nr:DHHA1 domain-containing protein [Campylobacter canadensis]MBZ7987709.1 3'-to-5' oligoribonuclease B [Campylobacter canadensis]MBZ7994116.1 3'-to-5' oligoribonuclease B [Campylobacter canadensis]MBZ7995881.1 3'-to-5' oligoribonuclease B [Campylobacter canadensis]MBZ7997518.1 3'-to-5' oligoribonuclease B [Campylobacter canadensis]MBZ7999447.1 3'-to-5' oligoribonuclease B [Campylobacter canadensis]
MKLYHLSHTDLDGYSCQYVTRFYFKDYEFFNSNYGKEIEEKFDLIIDKIKQNPEQKAMILITDLNPIESVCEKFDLKVKEFNNVKLLLLDHHQTGLDCMQKYPWYFLDSKRCATKITYDFFSNIFYKDEKLSKLVDIVNAIDIWLSDSEYFELAKSLMQLVSSAKELNRTLFSKEQNEYIMFLIEKAQDYFEYEDANIKLEDNIHFIKKDFFKQEKNNTLCNLISAKIVKLLETNKDEYTIFYKDKKGLLAYDIGNVSVIGNDFLVKNPDYDFFLEINPGKKVSLRANNKIDVSEFAKIAFNGGGHANASGGVLLTYKDSSIYSKIKEQVKTHLEKFNEK